MFRLFRFLKKKEWFFFFVSLLFIMSQVWLDLRLPDYMSQITTLVEIDDNAVSQIWRSGGMMLLCSVGSLVCSVVVCFFASKIAAGFSSRLRAAMYDKVESFSLEEISRFSTASLITRSTNDVMQVQMFVVLSLQVVVKAPLMAAWAIYKIAGKEWQWSMATAVTVVILIVLMTVVMLLTFPRFKRIQWLQDGLNLAARENLTGIRVVRAYNAESYQQEKFNRTNTELLKNQLFANGVMTVVNPFMTLSMNCLSMSIYWIGALLINAAVDYAARVDIFANMIVFMSYAMQVIMSFLMIVIVFVIAPRAFVAANRVNEVLDTKPSIVDGKGAPETGKRGEIEFKNVSFTYPGGSGSVLSDISFKANRGETVAFIGSTGSGKTTLINLIPRLYDATEGEVLVDGINVKDYKLSELYAKIGYVSQKAVMFSGTVEDNVAYGASADRDKLEGSLSIAHATEFIDELEEKAEAHVAQGGTNFSGGQKQRMSIARALCRDAEILIFDDSFSALDFKTDRELRDELREKTAGVTKLIVAQRIGTIMGADKIIVLNDGVQVGTGTHAELLKSCAEYREIALSQLSEEELAI